MYEPNSLAIWMDANPTPLVPPWINTFCFSFKFPLLIKLDHAVKKHSGIQAASLKEIFSGIVKQTSLF